MTGSAITIVLVSDHPANRGIAQDIAQGAADQLHRSTGFDSAVLLVDAVDLEPATFAATFGLIPAVAAPVVVAQDVSTPDPVATVLPATNVAPETVVATPADAAPATDPSVATPATVVEVPVASVATPEDESTETAAPTAVA